MPYSSLSEARIKKLDGVPLTLAQVNWIARIADGIPEGQVEEPWAVAIARFKKSYAKKGGRWVKRKKSVVAKMRMKQDDADIGMCVCPSCGHTQSHKRGNPCSKAKCPDCGTNMQETNTASIEKKEDGRYHIMTISTAALKDREKETFDIECIDYDIAQAKQLGDYPEFRVLHKPYLGIGKVEKMRRVGIFAVDEGTSYDDPFSIEACEKMLVVNKGGKWRVSRGFRVYEASGLCPNCDEGLIFNLKHMVAGFRCPSCREVYLGYKRTLKDVHFRKARTFDVTVTDVPAVPWTSAAAFRFPSEEKESFMTKDQLKEKLLEAGISEDAIDERLKGLSDERLKEFDDIPDAVLLKEFEKKKKGKKEDGASDETVFVLDPDVLKEFSGIVEKALKEALEGLTIEVPDMEMELKELPAVDQLTQEIVELKGVIAELLEKDEKRLKELLKDAPRSARLRIKRYKDDGADDDEEEEDEDEEEKGKRPPFLKKKKQMSGGDVIALGDGTIVSSMTEAVLGGG